MAIFARAPEPGKAKTRLARFLGPEGAAQFQGSLVRDVICKVGSLRGVSPYLFFSGRTPFPLPNDASGRRAVTSYTLVPQRGADLGERLQRAFHHLLQRHPYALVVGTDSPTLSRQRLRQALSELRCCEAVLGPCPDGGYYLIGLRRLGSDLFSDIHWGTSCAFRETLRNLMERRFSCSVIEPLADIDRPADYQRLSRSLRMSPPLRRLAPTTWKFVKSVNKRRKSSSVAAKKRRIETTFS